MFQLDRAWRDIEDILTSDFFGVLDYLPRKSFLACLVAYFASLNPNVETPDTNDVDWDNAHLLFWPCIRAHDESVEPDIVIVTNRWVLVIEVKLESGLGYRQPWREFLVGRMIAEERGLCRDCVYYLILARTRLDIAPTFAPTESEKCDELLARTSYVKWYEVVAIVESWLRAGCNGQALTSEQGRILQDLLAALRKRRSIAFSGFAFANVDSVSAVASSFFCPRLFAGFLHQMPTVAIASSAVFLSNLGAGFATRSPEVHSPGGCLFFSCDFGGFAKCAPEVARANSSILSASNFASFLSTMPICTKQNSLIIKGITHEINRGT